MIKTNTYYELYRFFSLPLVYVLRAILALLCVTLLFVIKDSVILRYVGSYTMFFLMGELFLHFGINTKKPKVTVTDNKSKPLETLLFDARFTYESSTSTTILARRLLKEEEVLYLVARIGNLPDQFVDIEKEEVLTKAIELAQKSGAKYIATIDLFASYLLLTEKKTKYLDPHNLNDKNIISILTWVRYVYHLDTKLTYTPDTGGGYADSLVYGWNVETKKYTNDFTQNTLLDKSILSIVKKDKEFELLTTALAKDEFNNVILVGPPGVGKTTLVKQFAYASYIGNIADALSGKRVYELFIDRVLAGVANQGELQKRLDDLLEDVSHSGNDIILIQNLENIFGGGGFSFDASGVLFDVLKNGRVQIIGTTTPSAYRSNIRTKSINEFFEVITLEEPSASETLFILLQRVPFLEKKYKVLFTYNALVASIDISTSYFPERFLPAKAIDLLEEVAVSHRRKKQMHIRKENIIEHVEKQMHVRIADPTGSEKEKLLNLEKEIHKRIIDQKEAVMAISNAMRRLRSGFLNKKRPVGVFLFLGPTGVGKTETAKALASIYFGSEDRMIRLDMSEYQNEDSLVKLLNSSSGKNSFVNLVRENPFSLILLDEFEKAHPDTLNLFLQVFEDGRLTDDTGSTVSFINTIIIATSNAGSEMIREKIKSGSQVEQFKQELYDSLLKKNVFKPELLNRFDDVIVYKPLSQNDIVGVARLLLIQSLQLLEEKDISLDYNEEVIGKIANEAFDIEKGARNVRRYIQNNIESMLSKMILDNSLKKGDKRVLTLNEKGDFILR